MESINDNSLVFYTLNRIYSDSSDMIKQFYIWQISESEKDKFCCTPVENQVTEFSDEGFENFQNQFKNIVQSNLYYMLKINNTLDILGWIAVNDYNPRNQTIEISYYFPKQYRSQGYGSIIMSLFLKEVFNTEFFWKINKIYAETSSYNTSSVMLLEKFNFKLDGRIREHYWIVEEKYDQLIYTLLRKDYFLNKSPKALDTLKYDPYFT